MVAAACIVSVKPAYQQQVYKPTARRKTSKLVIPANVKQSVYFIKDIIQQCRLRYVTYM